MSNLPDGVHSWNLPGYNDGTYTLPFTCEHEDEKTGVVCTFDDEVELEFDPRFADDVWVDCPDCGHTTRVDYSSHFEDNRD